MWSRSRRAALGRLVRWVAVAAAAGLTAACFQPLYGERAPDASGAVAPGVRSTLFGKSCYLYGAHQEQRLKGRPGQVLARRDGAICIATVDGAVWVSHLKIKGEPDAQRQTWHPSQSGSGWKFSDTEQPSVDGIKLPAARVLEPLLRGVPDAPLSIDAPADYRTFRETAYTEEADVGYLSFDFYNGAMSTAQCYRLRDAFLYARSRPTRVIVLFGGRDSWSNGIDLNAIEASVDPAEESWRNINAIDDLLIEILNTTCHLVIAGLRGNAGAGGAMLALAADHVYAMSGVVLNPHYRSMGLCGSEYWTYTLPRRVGPMRALKLTESCQPIGAQAACQIGLIDDAFGNDANSFEAELREQVARLAQDREFRGMLRKKHESRLDDECLKPLAAYRAEELDRMRINFFGPNRAYHEARRRFVLKGKAPPRESGLSALGGLDDFQAALPQSQGLVTLGEVGVSAPWPVAALRLLSGRPVDVHADTM